MKIAVIGCGYVGLTTAVGFSSKGHEVIGVENDEARLLEILRGSAPFEEKGFNDELITQVDSGRLSFTDNISHALRDAEVVIIAVNTPLTASHQTLDTGTLSNVFEEFIEHGTHSTKCIIVKSTVPVGVTKEWSDILRGRGLAVDVVYCPEFLSEGNALHDFNNPHRIVVGTRTSEPNHIVAELHECFTAPTFVMDYASAELAKLCANTMLAARITIMNEMAKMVGDLGGDILRVKDVLTSDPRIGSQYLHPSVGWGGPCFPKDVTTLSNLYDHEFMGTSLLTRINQSNLETKGYWADQILDLLPDGEPHVTITIWGATFKANTSDLRRSPAVDMISSIWFKGHLAGYATIKLYDPTVTSFQHVHDEITTAITVCSNAQEATIDSDMIVVLTGWDEFAQFDPSPLLLTMKNRIVFDGCNILNPKQYTDLGFTYQGLGRPLMKGISNV